MCAKPNPGFSDLYALSHKFSRTNMGYKPVFTPETLPREGSFDEACCPRVRECLHNILNRYAHSGLAFLTKNII